MNDNYITTAVTFSDRDEHYCQVLSDDTERRLIGSIEYSCNAGHWFFRTMPLCGITPHVISQVADKITDMNKASYNTTCNVCGRSMALLADGAKCGAVVRCQETMR